MGKLLIPFKFFCGLNPGVDSPDRPMAVGKIQWIQRMKHINFIIISSCLFIFAGTAYVWAGPRAVPVAPSFEFEPVLEGEDLTHDFIIRNQGDAPLNITDVRPP
jgi:hypothetical protein